MEGQRSALTLVVLTWLQLCRAEIKDQQPQWYAANVINDGFQPKSISEIFSTEASFSTTNPIIVAPKINNGSPEQILLLSTISPPSSLSSSPSYSGSTVSSTPTPFATSKEYETSVDSSEKPFQRTEKSIYSKSEYESLQPLMKLIPQQPQAQRNVQVEEVSPSTQVVSIPTYSTSVPTQESTFYQAPSTETTPRFTFPQDLPSDIPSGYEPQTSHLQKNIPPLSNYFVIYQQGLQNYQNPIPSSSQQPLFDENFSTSSPITSSSPSTFGQPKFSTTSSFSPDLISSTGSPITQEFLTSTRNTPPRVSITSLSTIGITKAKGDCTTTGTTTPMSKTTVTKWPTRDNILLPIKIKVVAPSGSITHVNINPTTKKPPTTTTKKPTTKRTSKPKKNTYDRCIQGCRKNGQNLCAAPLGQDPIDPTTLRGFPTVCHMACHNSFRKYAYEKIVDGSCGKLRNRIRPLDSDTKLKKDELHKVEYTVDDGSQKAVVEFLRSP